MPRLRLVPLVALSLAAALDAAPPQREAAPKDTRPDLLLVIADDQRADALGCAGHPALRTPNLDALAADGARFTEAFVTTAICAASRASILTSRYERSHGYTFGTPPLDRDLVAQSYPRLLRAAGYRTAFVGKLGVRLPDGAAAAMFDEFRPLERTSYVVDLPDGTSRHLTDLIGDHAIEVLAATDPRPLCLTIGFHAPHAEDGDPRQYVWPETEDGLYDDADVPAPPAAEPELFAAQPEFLRESLNRVRWGWRFDTEEKRRRMTRGYWRMITGLDRVVGRVLGELQRRGRAQRTVVVFTSDNGYFLGERGYAGKWLIHEPSIRVPLLVRDPRLPPDRRGVTIDAMALNVDLAPTLLELAGCARPAGCQGRSLVPWLRGERPEWRRDFFYEHLYDHARIPKSEGVRTDRFSYARYFEQQPVFEELYELTTDPHQCVNLAGDPAFRDVLERMRARCDELLDRYESRRR